MISAKKIEISSLTEWMEKIHLHNILEFRHEDNTKYNRLKQLCSTIDIKYNVPTDVAIMDVVNETSAFQKICEQKKNTKCNWRLIPRAPVFPKLRIRAVTFEGGYEWFKQQKINPSHYERLEIIKYSDHIALSSIFLINNYGIWGEVIKGDLWQLAYGIYKKRPSSFSFDFKKWEISNSDTGMLKLIKDAIAPLYIDDETEREKLRKTLNADFTNHYLNGYYEFIIWPGEDALFMDYNRVIYRQLKNINFRNIHTFSKMGGTCASPGMAYGKVKIIKDPSHNDIEIGEILVCDMITMEYIDLMQKAGAIIVEQGNVLSHAAIISRELKKPCIVMAKDITKKLKTDDEIFVNADNGTIVATQK